jgi:aryl-alcohol dehydrogenase-like predicted oxidoreductase
MKQVGIPGTDLIVSPICLGTTDLGLGDLQEDAAFELLNEYVEQGGNFIDTAHVYSNWIPGEICRSEKLIGKWLKSTGTRDRIVLGTKGAHPELDSMHISRLSPAEITQDLNESLEYLQTDHIDIYWLHRDDTAVPVAGILETLNEQVKAGKIRHLGCSNWKAYRIQEALDYAASKGIRGFVANQPLWSLAAPNLDKAPDKTLVAMDDDGIAFHKRTGMAAIPYSSQGKGFFTKLAASGLDGVSKADIQMYGNDVNNQRLGRIQKLANQYRVTVNSIVLAYLLSQPFTTIPIVGCKKLDHLHASLEANELRLTPEEISFLENTDILN